MRALCILWALLGLACTDFAPRSLLQAPRVIGVVAEPPELQVGETVKLTAIEYNPEPVERTWSLCLFSLGVFVDFECIDPSFVIPISETTDAIEVAFDSDLLSTFADLGDPGTMADLQEACGQACVGRDGTPRTFVDVQFTLESVWADGSSMKTIKNVRLRLDEEPKNSNPSVSDLQVEGQAMPAPASPGDRLLVSLKFDPDSVESYVDTDGRQRTEEFTYTWYSTAGKFTLPVTFGDDLDTTLQLPKTMSDDVLEVIVVARDGRGGTAFLNTSVPILGATMDPDP